ncbi:MAG: ATP-dependent Clp protease ATP-binding subunit [Chloroflexi bacterium]|nr:ATP-dependent Clp protease ATP-binding subunit [Chloroflexota bacterium]
MPPERPTSLWFSIDASSPARQSTLERAAAGLSADPEHGWLLADLRAVLERDGLYCARFSRRVAEVTVCYDPASPAAWGESVSREGTGLALPAPEYLIHVGAAILQRLIEHDGPGRPGPPPSLAFPELRIDPSVGERFLRSLRGQIVDDAAPGAPVRPGAAAPRPPSTRATPGSPARPATDPSPAAVAPTLATDGDWRNRVLGLEKRLKGLVFGQDEAIAALRRALVIHAAGLAAPNRPIGGFMFLGPTGVGKTELANALALTLFDGLGAMLRLDMSEYMESHALARLIGAPPGYVGFSEGGQLTEFVRKQPRCVVLFDEFDKAHRDVPNILLQVLDAGRLTDGQGRTTPFAEVILIMTSNLHAELFREVDVADPAALALVRQAIAERARRSYRPEFIARLDGLIVFNPLTTEILRKIAEKHLRQVAERATAAGQTVTWHRVVIDHLVQQAAADEGARAITKAARQVIEPLATRILERASPGGRFRLAVENGHVVVQAIGERRPRK